MESRKEATDVGDAGVAQAVWDRRQWQMHYQRHLHPCWRRTPLCHSHTCTHAQTHASKLIEASGLVPHQARGVMTATLFSLISPLLSWTRAQSHTYTYRYIYTYICAIFSPTLLCSLKCQAGRGLCGVPPESNKSWLELKQLVRPPRPSICWITVSQPVICEMKASMGREGRGHGRGQTDRQTERETERDVWDAEKRGGHARQFGKG